MSVSRLRVRVRIPAVSVYICVCVRLFLSVSVCAFGIKKGDGNARPLRDRDHVIFFLTRDVGWSTAER